MLALCCLECLCWLCAGSVLLASHFRSMPATGHCTIEYHTPLFAQILPWRGEVQYICRNLCGAFKKKKKNLSGCTTVFRRLKVRNKLFEYVSVKDM